MAIEYLTTYHWPYHCPICDYTLTQWEGAFFIDNEWKMFSCPHCNTTWSAGQLVEAYNYIEDPHTESYWEEILHNSVKGGDNNEGSNITTSFSNEAGTVLQLPEESQGTG